jgi:hypothetical protein
MKTEVLFLQGLNREITFYVGQNKNDYVGHQYGAIALFPDSDHEKANQQLKKIIRLLLQYHLRQSLISTCISCGYSLNPKKNIFQPC